MADQQQAKAILRFVRVAPRKARAVMDLIRGRGVGEAFHLLRFSRQRAARTVEKVLKSAVANAKQLEIGDVDDLRVRHAVADGGPVIKRFRARSMGRANPIKHRTSHITIVVAPKPVVRPSASPAKAVR
jgi:large subunit ribosomal protein L22